LNLPNFLHLYCQDYKGYRKKDWSSNCQYPQVCQKKAINIQRRWYCHIYHMAWLSNLLKFNLFCLFVNPEIVAMRANKYIIISYTIFNSCYLIRGFSFFWQRIIPFLTIDELTLLKISKPLNLRFLNRFTLKDSLTLFQYIY
jgi:hypothetical protein